MIQIREWKKSKKKGWEVDIKLRMPDGTWFQERRKAPVAGKTNALRWAQDREAHLLRNGPQEKEVEAPKEIPTLRQFAPRFIDEYARAERQKPSSIDSKQVILNHHLLPSIRGQTAGPNQPGGRPAAQGRVDGQEPKDGEQHLERPR